MNSCKYIMVDANSPVLFHSGTSHYEMALKFGIGNISTAGFVRVSSSLVDNGKTIEGEFEVQTYGKSESLKLRPAADDAYWIKKMLTD